ncbi:hypothetical protein V5799_020699 [Amblyomma americanum]|uniref:CCHC-type domain-containing protein n=1 Tax=Amblyomma americanum TaxID=6943 RepID=A0AAQ4ETC9_AMBAM
MARSERGVATAFVGRDESVSGPPPGYRFLLPTRRLMKEAKDAVLAAGGPSVKGGYCAIIDPCRKEIKVKIHWVPLHIPSETLRKALSGFGEVIEIRHEEWNVPGFELAESTTRVSRMVLKEGATAEELPHLFKFYGGSVFVVVSGRAPVSLRCRRRGHIRRDCQTPRCTKCCAFGHVQDGDNKEDVVDIEAAETTAPDDRRKKSASSEQESVCDVGNTKTSPSETPNAKGFLSNVTGTPPMTDQASAMNAEAEPVKEERASQDDTFGLAKRAKTVLPSSSQSTSEVRLQRLERQWLRATEAKGKCVPESRPSSVSPVRNASHADQSPLLMG